MRWEVVHELLVQHIKDGNDTRHPHSTGLKFNHEFQHAFSGGVVLFSALAWVGCCNRIFTKKALVSGCLGCTVCFPSCALLVGKTL